MELNLTGIWDQTDADGNLKLRLVDPATGAEHHANVPAFLIDELIMRFHKSVLTGATAHNKYATIPQLLLTDANIAHQPRETELMVSIDQKGWFVLVASNQILQHLRNLTDRVLAFRNNAPKSAQ